MTRKRTTENDLLVTGAGAPSPARRKGGSTRPRVKRTAETIAPVVIPPVVIVERETQDYTPSYEEIAILAYTYWEARGRQGGCPEEDWVRAEQELRGKATAAMA
jgi:hypothetical protein